MRSLEPVRSGGATGCACRIARRRRGVRCRADRAAPVSAPEVPPRRCRCHPQAVRPNVRPDRHAKPSTPVWIAHRVRPVASEHHRARSRGAVRPTVRGWPASRPIRTIVRARRAGLSSVCAESSVGYAVRTLRERWIPHDHPSRTGWRQEQRQDVRNDARRARIGRRGRAWPRTRSGAWTWVETRTARTSRTTGRIGIGIRAARTSEVGWPPTWTTRAAWPLCQQDAVIVDVGWLDPQGRRLHGGMAPRGDHHQDQYRDRSVHEATPSGMAMTGTIARPYPCCNPTPQV